MLNNIMKPDVCIYHGNCADGFGAAYAVWKRYGDSVQYHAGIYGNEPPDVTGKDVILVDFSYKKHVIEAMLKVAKSVFVLDHHKTAEADLTYMQHAGFPNFSAHFDMNKSGAMLAWNYFHPEIPAPGLIQHIQDRDLWKFELEGTREIQSALFSYPYSFEVWDVLADNLPKLYRDGKAIERKHFKDVHELLGVVQRRMKIGGHVVPVANLPYTMSSDAGHIMAKGEPFAACYYDTPNGRCFSLRSTDEGVDVSEIAKAYRGGGHRNAAGFTMPMGWEGEK